VGTVTAVFVSSFRSVKRALHFFLQLFLGEVSSLDTEYTHTSLALKKDSRFINVKQEWSFLGSIQANSLWRVMDHNTCNGS